MKLFSILKVVLATSTPLILLAENRAPEVSVEDTWRWNELELFRDYRIANATRGNDDSVWFSHIDGLLRYDGREVTSYPIEGIVPGSIIELFVSKEGKIYLITLDRLFIYDKLNLAIIDGLNYVSENNNLIVQTKNGQILLATDKGICEVSDSGLRYLNLDVNQPSSLLLDSDDNLWVVDWEGSYSIKVFELRPHDIKFAYAPIYKFPGNPENVFLPRLFMDSGNRVWVIDPDEQDRCFLYDNFQKYLAVTGLKKSSLWWETVQIGEPRKGEIWFSVRRKLGCLKQGKLNVYDFKDYPIPSSPPYLEVLNENKVLLGGRSLTPYIIDMSHKRWSRYVGLNFQCEDEDGNLWFLSDDRNVEILSGDVWSTIDAEDGIIDTPNRIIRGKNGSIWVSGSHRKQAAVANNYGGSWRRYTFPEVGKIFSNLAAVESLNGNFIFGNGTPQVSLGDAKGGAVIFQKQNDTYEGVHIPPPAFQYRTANIVERVNDGLWFSSRFVFRSSSKDLFSSEKMDIFGNEWIDHMLVDRKNDLWVACFGVGVYRYDGDQWTLHGKPEGLNNKNVIQLFEYADRGGIIALTEEGMFRFDGISWAPWVGNYNYPFLRENHTIFEDSSGAVWINYANRSFLVEPSNADPIEHLFQTIRHVPDREAPETKVALSSDRFPEGSLVQAMFGAKDYWNDTSSEDLMYSWSLDGGNWSPFTGESSVTLTNIGPGEYALQARAMDRSGNVDPHPATIYFQVVPHLWKQTWFILSIALLFSIIFLFSFLLFRMRVRSAIAIEEFKLDFFTNISHELRNPLAVIIAPIERLLKRISYPDIRHDLQIVLRNARRMQSMVDQLLEFRKIEKGRWFLNPSNGEIMDFLRNSISNFEPLWKQKGITLQLSTNPDSYICSFDPEIFQKIIDNLLSNAIKYTAEDSKIVVDARIAEIDDHFEFVLVVEDEGPGIPLHERDHVLKPFYRIKREDDKGGIGVGLALVSQLVNLAGGEITLTSPVPGKGVGSHFKVKLPVEGSSEQVVLESSQLVAESPSGKRPTLLLVEDNEDFRYVLSKELSESFRILEAGDGDSGFEKASKENPDLIVSDVLMPGLGGFELCEKLKSDPETSHIPIILLTAKSSVDHRITGMKAGADAYIPKPLDISHLRARLDNLLETRRKLKEKFSKQIIVQPTEIAITSTDEVILRKSIKIVEANMHDEDFDVASFARLMGMSQSSLTRKLKAMTGQTPNAFCQKIRLKKAAFILSSGGTTVSEAASLVGIYDVGYFGKLFRKEFGTTPSGFSNASDKSAPSSKPETENLV